MIPAPRILVIPSWYPPDGGYFFREHSEALAQSGWQVDVLVNRVVGIRKMIQAGPSALKRYRVVREGPLRVVRTLYLKIPGSGRFNTRNWATGTLRAYRRYERRFGRPGLLLAHSVTWAGYAASLIREKYQIPYVVVEHRSFFVWSTPEAQEMVRPWHLPFYEKAYRQCSRLVPVSGSLLTGLTALMPWAADKVTVIPNMIREEMFRLPERERDAEPFIFLWAGRLEHVKGLDLLLEAVRGLKSRTSSPFEVRLAGKGSLREPLQRQARDLGIGTLVRFLGRLSREEIQKEMQQSCCFVLPSRYEAFGAVLIEAMATGMPVIATLSGGPEHIVNEENGILIEPEHPEKLIAAMEEMMANYSRYLPDRIRAGTLERFGQSQVMEKYNQLFREVLAE